MGAGEKVPGMVTLTIEGRTVSVPKGTSVLHAALDHGIPVPYFCDHRKLDPIGACRMCVVEVEKMPKLQTSCTQPVAEGMVVRTESDEVIKARRGVLEFLLINHPLDCPVCDKGGECDLQDFAFYHGPGKSRFIEEKVKYPKPVPLSDRILLDMERCVLCERCVRYFEEVTEENQLVLLNRGVSTMIGTFNGEPMDSNFQGNIQELCPVGALTSSDWRFSARPWDLRSTPSICHGCSVGCNVQVQTRDDRVVRYMSRANSAVDDGWLCDRGRYGFHFVNAAGRLVSPALRRGDQLDPVGYPEAVAELARALQQAVTEHGPQSVAALASPEATNEELFLFQRWMREVIGSSNIDHRTAPDPGTPETHDFRLAIEDFSRCDAIIVLGDQATADLVPIVELRLKKARRRDRTRVLLQRGRPSEELVGDMVDADRVIGIIGSEELAGEARSLAARVRESGREVFRLTALTRANSRGALDMGCLPDLLPGYRSAGDRPGLGTWEILDAAIAGQVKVLIVMGPSPLAAVSDDEKVVEALRAVDVLAVLDVQSGPLAAEADILLPLHTFAEKEGTYTNLEGRVQRLRQAIPPVASTPPDWRIMQDLANAWEAGWDYRGPADVMREIVAAVPAYGVARAGDRANWWTDG